MITVWDHAETSGSETEAAPGVLSTGDMNLAWLSINDTSVRNPVASFVY